MAQTNFTPNQNSTHAEATIVINNNADDAESRFSSLESLSLPAQYGHQTPASSGGSLVFDVDNGYNGSITLTEDTTLSFTGASAGGSGLLLIKQDATGGWSLSSSYKIFTGQLGDIATLTAGGLAVISISWYFDGSEYFLWISDPA